MSFTYNFISKNHINVKDLSTPFTRNYLRRHKKNLHHHKTYEHLSVFKKKI